MALSNVMGNVPFLGGYLASQQQRAQEEGMDMQRQAQAMSLAGLLQQQRQKAAEAQRMQGFRSALQQLGPNATQEQLAQIGAQFADSPDKVMQIAQQSMDRRQAAELAAANRPDNRPEILRLGEMLEKLPANHPARPFIEKRAAFLAGGERDKVTSKWGDPYQGPTGETLQRDELTGQIRQVVTRPPQIRVDAGQKSEPLVPVMQDGKPVLLPRSQAVGKAPASSNRPMSAAAEKELIQTDEEIQGSRQAKQLFAEALKLNDKAMGFLGAGAVSSVGTLLPDAIRPSSVDATQELDNIISNAALPQLKAIFGGMPTEGERKILLEVQGSSSKNPSVRKSIFERAQKAVDQRLKFAEEKAKKLRSGSYFTNPSGDSDWSDL